MSEAKLPWEKFKRTHAETFYGCVDRDGFWFDSSPYFDVAVHWCVMAADVEPEDELDWMREEGAKLGFSIIHSDLLRKMYEKGLIK